MTAPPAIATNHAPSIADYPSIQAAIDANPGQPLFVPAGDHTITRKIQLRGNGSGLYGPGRIIQQTPDQPILELENLEGAEIRDLTLARPDSDANITTEGILAIRCRDLVVDNVRILDNRTTSAAIRIHQCQNARVSRSLVRNYMRLAIDDRTANDDWGYAFRCTDGTGIGVSESQGTLLEANRVVEERFVPTRELRDTHQLGQWVKRNPQKGRLVRQEVWDAGTTDNWQQGSAILVTSPESSDFTRILGNHIENAAQGIDLHADRVIVTSNVVVNAFIGMKAMHGSRNILIQGNQFARNSLWAIGLMPGASAHPGNTDGGSIIANNIISDFGLGDAAWIWGPERSPLKFDGGQQPDDPPLTDVLIQGNIVHTLGAPRYAYAVIIAPGESAPRGLRFSGNLFHTGTSGISNIDLQP